jgi:hypothetical protein
MAQRSGTTYPFVVARGQPRCAVTLLLALSVLSEGCASRVLIMGTPLDLGKRGVTSTLTQTRRQMSDEDGRTAFGPLGVATIERTPILSSDRPATPASGAKRGAEIGWSPLGWGDELVPGDGRGAIGNVLIKALAVAITPFTASIGAAIGALAGKSSEDTERAVSSLEGAIREANVQQRLRDIVIARVSREYGAVVPVNDTATAHEEIGTVVEAEINFIYLDGGDSRFRFNPKLTLSLAGVMRIHRRGKVVHVTSIRSSGAGDQHILENWAADNAKRLGEGIARELESLAGDIASKLFAWRIANERWGPGLDRSETIICPGSSVWERLGLDLRCPPTVTAPKFDPKR